MSEAHIIGGNSVVSLLAFQHATLRFVQLFHLVIQLIDISIHIDAHFAEHRSC